MADKVPPNTKPTFAAPIPTPTHGAGGTATAIFSTHIAASPATVAEVIIDTSTYGWNKWVPRAVIDSSSPASSSVIPLPSSLAHLTTKQKNNTLLLRGTKFHFEVHMNPESASFRRTDLEVTVLEDFEREDGRKGIRVAWKTKGDGWFLKAERVQDFLEALEGEDGKDGCEYVNYETFYGPATWAVKTLAGGSLERGLGLWMDGLKTEAEKRSRRL